MQIADLEEVAGHEALEDGGDVGLGLRVLDPVHEGAEDGGLLPGALVVAPEQLGQLLVEVEDDVGVPVLARHRVSPQLLHEEHLVRELRGGSCQ